MDYRSIITTLYYLLIYADGKVNERELALGRKMIEAEGFDVAKFDEQLEGLKAKNITSFAIENFSEVIYRYKNTKSIRLFQFFEQE